MKIQFKSAYPKTNSRIMCYHSYRLSDWGTDGNHGYVSSIEECEGQIALSFLGLRYAHDLRLWAQKEKISRGIILLDFRSHVQSLCLARGFKFVKRGS
jgi:hypothetical protein